MAALTHLAVGLAAKPVAPKIPLAILILSAYAIDLVWTLFFFLGIEHMPEAEVKSISIWSHSLLMALLWSLLTAALVWLISRNKHTSLIIGLLVFSHWAIDFISHPMTAVFPSATGLPLFLAETPLVGLGFWSTQTAVNIGEYGSLTLGMVIYLITLLYLRKQKNSVLVQA